MYDTVLNSSLTTVFSINKKFHCPNFLKACTRYSDMTASFNCITTWPSEMHVK